MLSVDTRRAPEHPFPTPVEDAYAALRWLHERAGELGVDRGRIAVMGDSAGGGLAAALRSCTRERGGPAIARQILLMPMLDDHPRRPAHRARTCCRRYDDRAASGGAASGDEGEADAAHRRRLQPARGRSRAARPTSRSASSMPSATEDLAYATKLAGRHPCESTGVPHEFNSIAFTTDVARRATADRVRVLSSL